MVICVFTFGSIFETNKAGFYQIKQAAISGDLTVRNDPGTYGQYFGDITTYEIAGDIFLSKDNEDGGTKESNAAERVLFPNGYADINFVGLYVIPRDPEIQKALHIRFGSDENVKYMIKQQIIESLKNTGTLMSAEEAYSYKRAEFVKLAREQALYGLYESKVEVDTIVNDAGMKQEIKRYSVKYDEKTGKPIIAKESFLATYHIELPQFNVKDMDFDPILVGLIDSRKTAQKAQQDAITAQANGEALIAKEKATQEIFKMKEVTIAQKEKDVAVLKASKEFEVEKLNAQTALQTANKIKAEGFAKAEANRALVAAGLTPQQKMEMEIKIADVVSKNISGATTPSVVFMGNGAGGGASEVMNIFGAERSLELIKKIKESVK